MLTNPEGTWIEFGTLTRPHGIKGELRLVPMHPEATLPEEITTLRLRAKQGGMRILTLTSCRLVHQAYLIRLEGVHNRDEAAMWSGSKVDVNTEELGLLPEGEYYLFELIGALATDEDSHPVGTVDALLGGSPHQELLRLKTPNGERLLPFTQNTLLHFDRDKKCLRLRIVPGLLD